MAQLFRTDVLAQHEKSPPFTFIVLGDAPQTFIRVIAHLQANGVHGGAPPTILLQAGSGQPAAVGVDVGQVDILGSGEARVATATSERAAEDIDTYLVTVNRVAPSGPWRLQVLNNEPEPLTFAVFISHTESETLQPWLEVEGRLRLGAAHRSTSELFLRNVGTAALNIVDQAGDRFGPAQSPASIFKLERIIDRHSATTMVVECAALPEVALAHVEAFEHVLRTDDPIREHGEIAFAIESPLLPETRCRENDGCREFVRRLPPDEFQCETCFHDAGLHGLPTDDNRFPR